MEKKGILGDSKTPGRRPGDVTVPLWRRGLGLAIDVAVTCPFAINNLSRSDPCEYYAEAKKHKYYDADFKNTQYEFAAMVFESTGGVNEEGLAVLRQLFALLPSGRVRSSVSTVVELGPEFPVTSNLP